jgi:hypothetical protein
MRKTLAVIALCVWSVPAFSEPLITEWSLSPALRTDEFRWNIAGDINGGNPNILSELSWKKIKVQQLSLSGALRRPNAYYAEASGAVGMIVGGRNQDSDYAGNHRTLEFSRSNNDASQGRVDDLRVGAGFPFEKPGDSLVIPLIGWGYSSERLFMSHGNQTVSALGNPMPLGPFSGLNSNYRHRWQGAWVGLRSGAALSPRSSAQMTFRYFPNLSYLAAADWNLRDDFSHPKSYEHQAKGKGWEWVPSLSYDVSSANTLTVDLSWRHWRAGPGTDRVFFADGTSSETRLNEVVWDSLSFELSLAFRTGSPASDDDY